jgi:hypothetical protein
VVDKRAISASIVGTANAQGKIYGLPTAAYAMAPTSTVTHNGSLMEVYDRGGRMEIRYADPRPKGGWAPSIERGRASYWRPLQTRSVRQGLRTMPLVFRSEQRHPCKLEPNGASFS